MAELVAVPELVQELLFLHLCGEFFLLEAGAAALHVEEGVVLLLHGLIGPGALALDLELLLRRLRDAVSYLRSPCAKLRYTLLALRQLSLCALCPGLHVRKRLRPRLAVARYAAPEQLELSRGIFRRAPFGLERGQLVAYILQLARGHVQLVARRGQLALQVLRLRRELVPPLCEFAAVRLQSLQLRAPGQDARVGGAELYHQLLLVVVGHQRDIHDVPSFLLVLLLARICSGGISAAASGGRAVP